VTTKELAATLYEAWFKSYYGPLAKQTPYAQLPESITEVWEFVAVVAEASTKAVKSLPRKRAPLKPVQKATETTEVVETVPTTE
jgi:hypothetical protein